MLNRHPELDSGQHPLQTRGLRVKPAMTIRFTLHASQQKSSLTSWFTRKKVSGLKIISYLCRRFNHQKNGIGYQP